MAPELLEARVVRLATVAEAARALLAALPLCVYCEGRATRAPAEALERALDAAVAAALAGEP